MKITELLARSGALSLKEIVDQTGYSREEVVDVLRSFRGAFVQLTGTGEARWGLAA
jgi:DNA-binding transcriptional regulator GbsR (MarR family)